MKRRCHTGNPLLTYSIADQLYSFLLASRYVSPYVYDPSYALSQDADVWEIIQNNLNTLSELQRRRQALIRPLRCVPRKHAVSRRVNPELADGAKRKAAIVGEMLSYVDDFDMARSVLADSAILGRRYAEIQFQEIWASFDGTPPMLWIVPVKLIDVDRRRFRWRPIWTDGPDRRKIRTDLEMFDTNYRMERVEPGTTMGKPMGASGAGWHALTDDYRRRLIEDMWAQTEDRIGYSRGAIEALFFADYYQTNTHKKILAVLDKYAILVAKLDRLQSASTDIDNTTLVSNTKDALQKVRYGDVFVLQQSDTIETLDVPTGAADLSMEYVRYWDGQVSRFLNGSLRPAGHSGGQKSTGARAQAETESETSEAFYQLPRDHHTAVLTRDLVGAIAYWNEHNFKALGLGEASDPILESQQVKRESANDRLEVIAKATAMVAVREADVYEAAELAPPDSDEATVGGPGSAFDPAAQAKETFGNGKEPSEESSQSGTKAKGDDPKFAADIPKSRWKVDRWKLVHRCGKDCEHPRCARCKAITKKGKFSLVEARNESENFPGSVHPNCDCEWVRLAFDET